ncbi:MAG: TlpA family protein disulfide reductase [Rikenellaceae bacterium]|nr:TlpA family protein disulfide reductase [Rikenellaceae bacterium]
MRNILIGLSLVGGCLLTGCSGDRASVSGRLLGNDNRMVYLEQVLPGSQEIVDSVATDDKGYFSLKVSLPDGQATIYNLLCRQERIPLLLSPGEKVKVHTVGSLSRNYTVEGSEGSQELKRLGEIFSQGTNALDSLFNLYAVADDDGKQDLYRDYINTYYKLKREHIEFIILNSNSLSAVYALYQRLPNDDLFNGTNDLIYYRLVADSTSKYFPSSPYVAALQKEVEAMDSQMRLVQMFEEKLGEDGLGYPDFEMKDMYDNTHRLSSLSGQVILLDFWTVTSADNRLLNAELKEIYNKYRNSGFEIYQVSVDRTKSDWVLAVQDQRLPWISVNDFRGSSSLPVTLFNVQQVPSNFIIDRNGEIAGRDLYGENLEKKIRELL